MIPQIGYGTYELRGDDCLSGVAEALRLGYRHIDTASVYRNEEQIASVLGSSSIPRASLFITSKIGPGEQGREESKKAVSAMLHRLKTDYLDCVLIHWPGVSKLAPTDPKNADVRLETWRTLIELRNAGIIKHIGVSNFKVHHLTHLIQNTAVVPEMNQFELHPLCFDKELVNFCNDKKILIEAYSPLARQHEDLIRNPTLLSLAEKYSKTLPQVVLRWALHHGFVIIPKSKRSKYIADNINILDFKLEESDINAINALNRNLHTCWDPVNVKF